MVFLLQILPCNHLFQIIYTPDTEKCMALDDVENDETIDDVYYFELIEYSINAPQAVSLNYYPLVQAGAFKTTLEIETPPPNVLNNELKFAL